MSVFSTELYGFEILLDGSFLTLYMDINVSVFSKELYGFDILVDESFLTLYMDINVSVSPQSCMDLTFSWTRP